MSSDREIADRIEGIPHPGEYHSLVGHGETLRQLDQAFSAGKLHHAILLSGLQGIGKATLALRFAAHLFRSQEERDYDLGQTKSDPVQGKIEGGAHPNLLHLTRPWDAKTKRFKTKLTVDEVRLTNNFFGSARAEDGWRVAIVDAVDDMNNQASNALLKILEEPPERTLFFVLAHSMASVLPTIRSRCQHVPLKPLDGKQLFEALEQLGLLAEVRQEDLDLLLQLSSGSVRKAIILQREGGIELYREFSTLASKGIADWERIHGLADRVSGSGKDNQYRLLIDFVNMLLEDRATGKSAEFASVSTLARWAEVWEKTQNSIRTAESYNLDRKQVILNLFQDMGEVARA